MNRAKPDADNRSKEAGVDFLQLSIRDAPVGGRAGWLADRLREAISDGRLPVGGRLPATRGLAVELGVSRGVVTEAYQRLAESGQVAGQGRRGTIVVAAPAGPATAPVGPPPTPAFVPAPGRDIFDTMRAAPASHDLTPGLPDVAAFPRAAWLRAERSVLSGLSGAELGYGDPTGARPLRVAVANWLARNRGVPADPGRIVVVAGVAQALCLLALVLRERGDTRIAVEDPGSLGARQHLNYWGIETPPVPVDGGGLRVGELDAPAVLATPAHQFPTGVVLDGARRRELLGWAAAGGLVIEDDYDAEHRYDRAPVPALASLLADRVCYLGSVSKLLAPALRIGWMLPPAWLYDDLVAAKRNADLGNATLAQLVLARLLESGDLERHLRMLRRRHRTRRDAVVSALSTVDGSVVHGTAAGLHLLVTFEHESSDVDIAERCLARGVKVQPLSWHRQLPGPPGLVLGYAARSPGELTSAIGVVADVLATRPGPAARRRSRACPG